LHTSGTDSATEGHAVKRVLHLVNEVGLGWFAAAIVGAVALFAVGYWMLAGQGQLVYTWDPQAQPGFLDSLYFSIVTISSLGYGDIRPLGWARALVGLEVLVGLAFLGLLVAKISSVKQDYILTRIYGGVVDEKLVAFAKDLEDQRGLYRTTAALLMDGEIDPGLTTTFRRDTPGATFFSGYRQLLSDLSDLLVYEASNHALFGVVQDSHLEAVYDAVRGMLRRTTLLWERDPDAARELVLGGNRREIEQICELADRIARLGIAQSRNADIVAICRAVLDLTERIRDEVVPAI
jgi:hypothetical protein